MVVKMCITEILILQVVRLAPEFEFKNELKKIEITEITLNRAISAYFY
jgi:hypothetical protein